MTAFPEELSPYFREGITAEEYDRMPEELCRKIEIVDGIIHMSPSPFVKHNRVARRIAHALEDAAPRPWKVEMDVDLRISEVPLTNRRPDVIVFQGDEDDPPILPEQALLTVEVMSQGSVTTDRHDKPAEYAAVGIPHFWRVERTESGLVTYTFILNQTTRTYLGTGAFSGILKVEQPFPVEIDLSAAIAPFWSDDE